MIRRKVTGRPAGMWILDAPRPQRSYIPPTRVVACAVCEGDGYCGPSDRCEACSGTGEVRVPE